ncbi:MAG TPA: PEP/pyruvate-binding domain-containing protein [bacterium]|nr:PEP/pyruvate-binding domain-containing protein [bacterium]
MKILVAVKQKIVVSCLIAVAVCMGYVQAASQYYLAPRSLFDELKKIRDTKLAGYEDPDMLIIASVIGSFGGGRANDREIAVKKVQEINDFLSHAHPGVKITLKDQWTKPATLDSAKITVPIVLLSLADGSEIEFLFLDDPSRLTTAQLATLKITPDHLISLKELGLGDVGIVRLPRTIMSQTVNNPGRRELAPELVHRALKLLASRQPAYWKEIIFQQLGLVSPGLVSIDKGWETFVAGLIETGVAATVNKKYTSLDIDKLRIRFYSAPASAGQGVFLHEDGRRLPVYSHLYMKKEGVNELEIYLPEFLVDEQRVQRLFAQQKIMRTDVSHILAQLVDREIGSEIFGIPEAWMQTEQSRLNLIDFTPLSEAMLARAYIAKDARDTAAFEQMLARFSAQYPGYPAEVGAKLASMSRELRQVWDGSVPFPSTTSSLIAEKNAASAEDFAEAPADPLYETIRALADPSKRDEKVIVQTMRAIFKRINREFRLQGLVLPAEEFAAKRKHIKDIQSYATECYTAYGQGRYEDAIRALGRLRAKEAALRSDYNLDRDLRDKVRASPNFRMLDMLGDSIDQYFSQFIEINGINNLQSIVGGGHAVDGQIRIVRNDEEYARACEDAKPWEIIVIAFMPDATRPMAKVRGIITGNVGALQSHEATRARAMKIPAASLAHAPALLSRLDGKWVSFKIQGGAVSIVPFSDERRVQEAIADSRRAIAKEIVVPSVVTNRGPNYMMGFEQMKSPDYVGNKAYKLAILKKKGFDIPDADAVPFAAYQRFLDANPELKSFIEETLNEIKHAPTDVVLERLARIKQKIVDTPLPAEIEKEIRDGLEKGVFKAGTPVVVRSTTSGEDRPDMPGAGFFDSYANVKSVDDIVRHIKMVWASVWNPKPYAFRVEHGIDHFLISPAVLIQKMVSPDLSFVIFTANLFGKEGEQLDQVMIEMVQGLGESIVGDAKEFPGEPMRFVYDKKHDKVVSVSFGNRTVIAVPDEETGGSKKAAVRPMTKKEFEALVKQPAEDFIRKLGRIATGCEGVFEKPQDMEGAIRFDGRKMTVSVVQSRDIEEFPDYYPVREDAVIREYGEAVERMFRDIEPVMEPVYSIDSIETNLEKGFIALFSEMDADMDPKVRRYIVPLMKYIYNYSPTGPKVLASGLWCSLGAHERIYRYMRELPPRMTARLLSLMAVDLDDLDVAGVFPFYNRFTQSSYLIAWDKEYTREVLKHIGPEELGLLVKELSRKYKHSVIPEGGIKQGEMCQIISESLDQFGEKQLLRCITTLDDAALAWWRDNTKAPMPVNGHAMNNAAMTMLLCDESRDSDRIVDIFRGRKMDKTIPLESASGDIGAAALRKKLVDSVKPAVIILDVRSGKAIKEFLVWLKESPLTCRVILVREQGVELPESFYAEYNVTKSVERDAVYEEKLLASLSEVAQDLIAQTAPPVEPAPRRIEPDQTETNL